MINAPGAVTLARLRLGLFSVIKEGEEKKKKGNNGLCHILLG